MLTYLRWSAQIKVKVKTTPWQPPSEVTTARKPLAEPPSPASGAQLRQGTEVHGKRGRLDRFRPKRYDGYVANDPDQLLKAQDVAEIIRFSARTIRRWTALGLLDDCLIRTPGGKYRYREDAIRARFLAPKTSGSGVPLTTSAPDPDPNQEGSP